MGFDVSNHPVDVQLVHERLIPYVMGGGGIDDLVESAVRIAKVRFRANAWGLGVLNLHHSSDDRIPDWFDSDLHVWGRPFFITNRDSAEVTAEIDRYLACGTDQVDEIAGAMIARLNPALVGAVKPSAEGSLPDEPELTHSVRWKVDLFREAYVALQSDELVTLPSGDEMEPAELFFGDFMSTMLEFASTLRPGWMARGYVWPTHLLQEARLDVSSFQTPEELFKPILDAVPSLANRFDSTITENYMLGGYVPASKVPAVLATFQKNEEAIVKPAKDDGWEGECRVALQKIRESLADAVQRGCAFVEATEIYSAPMGIMN